MPSPTCPGPSRDNPGQPKPLPNCCVKHLRRQRGWHGDPGDRRAGVSDEQGGRARDELAMQ
eukprot:14146073-Alexandrium_andersonii.AAC.1